MYMSWVFDGSWPKLADYCSFKQRRHLRPSKAMLMRIRHALAGQGRLVVL